MVEQSFEIYSSKITITSYPSYPNTMYRIENDRIILKYLQQSIFLGNSLKYLSISSSGYGRCSVYFFEAPAWMPLHF